MQATGSSGFLAYYYAFIDNAIRYFSSILEEPQKSFVRFKAPEEPSVQPTPPKVDAVQRVILPQQIKDEPTLEPAPQKYYLLGKITKKPIHDTPPKIDESFLQTTEGAIIRSAAKWLIKSGVCLEATEKKLYESCEMHLRGGDRENTIGTCDGDARVWLLANRSHENDSLKDREKQRIVSLFFQAGNWFEEQIDNARKELINAKLGSLRFERDKLISLKSEKEIADIKKRIEEEIITTQEGKEYLQKLKQYEKERWAALGFTFQQEVSLYKGQKTKREFSNSVHLQFNELFHNKSITNIFLTIRRQNSTAKHKIALQPDRFRLYDSWCGEISYQALKTMAKDLFQHLSQVEVTEITFQAF